MSSSNTLHSFLSKLRNKMSTLKTTSPKECGDTSRSDVLFINGCDLPTLRRYRVSHQREQLELWGISTREVHYTEVRSFDADTASVFVVYRCPLTPEVEAFINRAHELGKTVWFDVDDLVIDTSYTDELPVVQSMSEADRAIFNDGVMRTGQTLHLCDGAIATTDRLAIELKKYVPQVFINRNVASKEMFDFSRIAFEEGGRRSDSNTVLGYFSGSMTHNADFKEIIPALAVIFNRYPNVYLKVVGDLTLPKGLEKYGSRIIQAEKVDWRDLPRLIRSVDINLAPLESTLFNEAKSENKWTEASLVGVPTIASNFGAFATAIIDGKTGILCSCQDEWLAAIEDLVEHKEKRLQIGLRAKNYVERYCITATSGYNLAEKLANIPHDLDHICPVDKPAKEIWVSSYLNSRGFELKSTPSIVMDSWKTRAYSQAKNEAEFVKSQGKNLLVLVYERSCGDDATFRYFGVNLEEHLSTSEKWGATHVFVDELAQAQDVLNLASGIMLIRCRIRPELLNLAKFAREASIPMGYFIDDNALGARKAPRIIQAMATDQNSKFERDFWTGVCTRFQLASDLCDAVVVTNQFFASQVASETTKPVYVIQSSLNTSQVEVALEILKGRRELLDNRFLIGYFSGTSSHQDDFELIQGSVIAFLKKHPDAALVLGGHFALDTDLHDLLKAGSLIPLPVVDYIALQYLQASVDAVLAPLVIDNFTNCKSGLKVFEAGLVGTPACASNSFAYAEAIDDGSSGYICETREEWADALEKLFNNKLTRATMSQHARDIALDRYYGVKVLNCLESLCEKLTKTPISEISPSVEESLDAHSGVDWDNPFSANPPYAN